MIKKIISYKKGTLFFQIKQFMQRKPSDSWSSGLGLFIGTYKMSRLLGKENGFSINNLNIRN